MRPQTPGTSARSGCALRSTTAARTHPGYRWCKGRRAMKRPRVGPTSKAIRLPRADHRSYLTQPQFPIPLGPNLGGGSRYPNGILYYVDVWERFANHYEEPSLRDVALDGRRYGGCAPQRGPGQEHRAELPRRHRDARFPGPQQRQDNDGHRGPGRHRRPLRNSRAGQLPRHQEPALSRRGARGQRG